MYFQRAESVGASLIRLNKNCPPTLLGVWPSLPPDHIGQHTLPASSSLNPLLSRPQTYKGSPSVHYIKSKLKCLASKMFHHTVPITDFPVPSFLKGLQLTPQADLFHLVKCITTWSRTQGNKQKNTLAQTEQPWFLISTLSLIHWITGGQLSLVSSSVEWK